MDKFVAPASIYNFLKYCNTSSLDKEVLDCGAGGDYPPLFIFKKYGYKTYGIEISKEQIDKSNDFCKRNKVDLNIIEGDMNELPFKDRRFSFVYTYNTTVHMPKEDCKIAMKELERVVKSGGLLFVNFLSYECSTYCEGLVQNKGEFLQDDKEGKILFAHYEGNEVEEFFVDSDIIYKEKKIIERFIDGKKHISGFFEYILKKK
ncbi:class I SAM-dependent methyltransferase [Clostridium sp. D2Q-11]|uniref:Class I SAM-dependent methyltransferase n=1 Tax=Anaeromonas frigoriresistens TaxID=2683708 RepID=A0A942UUD8_9FIRM|nr:class I SAM-dependent methyltransferase [Anaeromonas frigoriresistens]MBS4538768.1 class I SAM-dependent methyltransferase [Anaeromonas frigoriresistens]